MDEHLSNGVKVSATGFEIRHSIIVFERWWEKNIFKMLNIYNGMILEKHRVSWNNVWAVQGVICTAAADIRFKSEQEEIGNKHNCYNSYNGRKASLTFSELGRVVMHSTQGFLQSCLLLKWNHTRSLIKIASGLELEKP